MNLRHLRFFAAAVEDGSITRAAQRLHKTQPAVSAGLKALEDELGTRLFVRAKGRALELTPTGERFHNHALRILAECDVARAEIAAPAERRRLRVGVLETLCPAAVAAATASLSPKWTVEIWQAAPGKLATWLRQRRIDVAWSVGHGAVVREEGFVCVTAHHHPFAGRGEISLADLAAEPFVFRAQCEMADVGRAQIEAAGHRLRVVARVADALARELVAHNVGVSLMPESLVGRLASCRVRDLELTRALTLHAGPSAPPEAVRVLSALVSGATESSERIPADGPERRGSRSRRSVAR